MARPGLGSGAAGGVPRLLFGIDFPRPAFGQTMTLPTVLDFVDSLNVDWGTVQLGHNANPSTSGFYPSDGVEEQDRSALLKMLQDSKQWSRSVVGKVSGSDWRGESVGEELELAAYLGLPAVLLPTIPEDIHIPFWRRREEEPLQRMVQMTLENLDENAANTAPLALPDQSSRAMCSIAEVILRSCRKSAGLRYWIPVPVTQPSGWWRFHCLRSLCYEVAARIPTLPSAPSAASAQTLLARCEGLLHPVPVVEGVSNLHLDHVAPFLGEDCPAVHLHPSLFHQDENNTKAMVFKEKTAELFVVELMKRRCGVCMTVQEPTHAAVDDVLGAGQCLVSLFNRHGGSVFEKVPLAVASVPYEDRLQVPMQPLGDHLPSNIYETFEEDQPKYQQYQLAVTSWLLDVAAEPSLLPSRAINEHGAMELYVVVLGAGRGPLVDAVLAAMETVNRALARNTRSAVQSPELNVIALEKNPSAVKYLRLRQQVDPAWAALSRCNRIRVVQCDGRTVSAEDVPRCDAVVSELLGSSGDNELSPECLEGFLAQVATWQQSTILSIPTSYTAYFEPVQAMVAHQNVVSLGRSRPDIPLAGTQGMSCPGTSQIPFVCRLWRHRTLAPIVDAAGQHDDAVYVSTQTVSQPAWQFTHSSAKQEHATSFDRCAELRFRLDSEALVTGIAGYFDCILYESPRKMMTEWESNVLGQEGRNVTLSTVPGIHTKGMFSWYPLYLPLPSSHHVAVAKSETLSVGLRRRHDAVNAKVWLEWSVHVITDNRQSPSVMNEGGRASHIALTSG